MPSIVYAEVVNHSSWYFTWAMFKPLSFFQFYQFYYKNIFEFYLNVFQIGCTIFNKYMCILCVWELVQVYLFQG